VAPVFADDLGAVIAAIDDAAAGLEGTWALEGPDVTTADGLVALLRDDDAPAAHGDGQAAARTLTELCGAPIDAVTTSYFSMPSRADAPDAAEAFGVGRTPLTDGLRATLAAAGADGR
jgi:hypothetical protein